MTIYNILWFIAGVSCGYVATLLIIFIMIRPSIVAPPTRKVTISQNGANGAHDDDL
jgi:hypothetical protein